MRRGSNERERMLHWIKNASNHVSHISRKSFSLSIRFLLFSTLPRANKRHREGGWVASGEGDKDLTRTGTERKKLATHSYVASLPSLVFTLFSFISFSHRLFFFEQFFMIHQPTAQEKKSQHHTSRRTEC